VDEKFANIIFDFFNKYIPYTLIFKYPTLIPATHFEILFYDNDVLNVLSYLLYEDCNSDTPNQRFHKFVLFAHFIDICENSAAPISSPPILKNV